MDKSQEIKAQILRLVAEFQRAREVEEVKPFIPGTSRINYAGRCYDEQEVVSLVDASLEFWLTHGRHAKAFETDLAKYLGVKHCALVNSGSSANLLAIMALTAPELGARRLERGDEVITVAAGFPTTVTPLIQYGAVPVFVDIEMKTINADPELVRQAITPRTKAIILAHTLGNPFDIHQIQQICKEHNLWLIEDNCDSLGSRYTGQLTGTFGDIGTSSFYPPHHMTMGEGGAVYTNNAHLAKIILSMRDWGRDCWCDSGKDDTCKKRFTGQFGSLPKGYDHKYVYSHLGYNLKATDLQAAVGCVQLTKLPEFVHKRQENYSILREALRGTEQYFIFPEVNRKANPSWFGFMLILRDGIDFTRNQIVEHLEKQNIQTRNLFGGNLVRQPVFAGLKAGMDYRISGTLDNTDKIMKDSFWVGVYPRLDEERLVYVADVIKDFIKLNEKR